MAKERHDVLEGVDLDAISPGGHDRADALRVEAEILEACTGPDTEEAAQVVVEARVPSAWVLNMHLSQVCPHCVNLKQERVHVRNVVKQEPILPVQAREDFAGELLVDLREGEFVAIPRHAQPVDHILAYGVIVAGLYTGQASHSAAGARWGAFHDLEGGDRNRIILDDNVVVDLESNLQGTSHKWRGNRD